MQLSTVDLKSGRKESRCWKWCREHQILVRFGLIMHLFHFHCLLWASTWPVSAGLVQSALVFQPRTMFILTCITCLEVFSLLCFLCWVFPGVLPISCFPVSVSSLMLFGRAQWYICYPFSHAKYICYPFPAWDRFFRIIQYVSSYLFSIIFLMGPKKQRKKENIHLDLFCSTNTFDECATF